MATIALAGMGLMGQRYVPMLLERPEVEHLHIASAVPVALDNPRITLFNDYRQLPPADATIIALPVGLHLEAAKELAPRSDALLIEKPLGQTLAESEQIASLDARIMAGLLGKYHPEFRAMYDNLHLVGRLAYVREELHEAHPRLAQYISGGRGVLLNNGLHTMDRFSRIASAAGPGDRLRPEQVRIGRNHFKADGEDTATGTLLLGDIPFSFNMSYWDADELGNGKHIDYKTLVVGSEGMLMVTGWEKCEFFGKESRTLFTYGSPLGETSQYERMRIGLEDQVGEFLRFASSGERTHPSVNEALDAQRLVEESYRVAR